MIKPESEWNSEERKIALRNFTALWAIQCGVDDKTFKLIAASESTKEAWDCKTRGIPIFGKGQNRNFDYKIVISVKNTEFIL